MTILFTVWLLHAAALMVPGPNVMFVTWLAASNRKKDAFFASIGIAFGSGIWAAAAVLGVKSLFTAFPEIRLLLKCLGALYLFYMALRLFRARQPSTAVTTPALSKTRALLQGLFVNLTNPKAALFFGSIFSTTFPEAPGLSLLVSAVILIVINGLCWHFFLTYVFSHHRIRHGVALYTSWVHRGVSTVFGAFGTYLLISALREARQ